MQCARCKQSSMLVNKEGRKQRNVCLDAQWRDRERERYPKKMSEYKKESYQNHREEQIRRVKDLKAMTEYCFVCKCNIGSCDVNRHVNTKKRNEWKCQMNQDFILLVGNIKAPTLETTNEQRQ